MNNGDSIYKQLHEYYLYNCQGYGVELFCINYSKLFIDFQVDYPYDLDARFITAENYPNGYDEVIRLYFNGNCDGYKDKIIIWDNPDLSYDMNELW